MLEAEALDVAHVGAADAIARLPERGIDAAGDADHQGEWNLTGGGGGERGFAGQGGGGRIAMVFEVGTEGWGGGGGLGRGDPGNRETAGFGWRPARDP